MKNAWMIRLSLLLAYGIPFAFLAVYGDATSGTMLFYGLMIAGFALLCWCSLKTSNAFVAVIGSILSFTSSWIAAKLSALAPMAHYFKPLTSHSLIVVISVVAVILHTMLALIYVMKKADRT